ncbi:uncharacterized protein FN964_006563 [Alca torda]
MLAARRPGPRRSLAAQRPARARVGPAVLRDQPDPTLLLSLRFPSPRATQPAPHGPCLNSAAGAVVRPPAFKGCRGGAATIGWHGGPAPVRLRPAPKRPLADRHRGARAAAQPANAWDGPARRDPASNPRGGFGPSGAGTAGARQPAGPGAPPGAPGVRCFSSGKKHRTEVRAKALHATVRFANS